MNIFILDKIPRVAAEYHCDKHVVKMILESAQMLSTAHWLHLLKSNGKCIEDFKRVRDAKEWLEKNTCKSQHPPYKMTHVKHPCTIWTSETIKNYKWLVSLLFYLCKEYTKRYKRIHKTAYYIKWFIQNIPVGIAKSSLQPFKICMDNSYKVSACPVLCYRNYYIKGKSHFAKWNYSLKPSWYKVN